LPALKVEWQLGNLRLVSNTSYFNRRNEALNDYTVFETALWGQVFTTLGSPPLPPTVKPYLNGPYYPSGFPPASSFMGNQQNNITQELRLQSDDPTARINWVAGLFYTHNRQTAVQIVSDPGLNGFIAQMTGGIAPVLEDGKYTFVQEPVIAYDKQIALYAQADAKLTDRLTLTAGVRAADTRFEASANYHGFVVGPPVKDSGTQHERPVKVRPVLEIRSGQHAVCDRCQGLPHRRLQPQGRHALPERSELQWLSQPVRLGFSLELRSGVEE
jgi:outer membrane receptor protein involved in Fe transport